MDAHRVFELCRRLLRDREFQRQVLDPDGVEQLAQLGLAPDDLAIARAFHTERVSAYWPLEGFRFRAISVARDSLIQYAPITSRSLSAAGMDLRALAQQFVEFDDYRDHGLNYCQAALDFLAYLASEFRASEFQPDVTVPCLDDAIALDRAMTGLLRRVAEVPRSEWPAPADRPALVDEQHYIRSPLTDAVALDHELTLWLEQPERIGTAPPTRARQFLIVQFIPEEDTPDALAVDASGFRLYGALERPLTVGDAGALLGDAQLAREFMSDFLDLDVIRPVAAE